MTMTLDTEREAFEAWVSAQPWFLATLYLARSGDEYADSCINSRWQGWKAHHLSRPAQEAFAPDWAGYRQGVLDGKNEVIDIAAVREVIAELRVQPFIDMDIDRRMVLAGKLTAALPKETP